MTVCDCSGCKYNCSGFCGRSITSIDVNGMCSDVWFNRNLRPNYNDKSQASIKQQYTVYEVAAKEYIEQPSPQITFDEYLKEINSIEKSE